MKALSVATVAPFAGLFGTVVGIINAFKVIEEEKVTGLTAVASGVATGLLATAVGLFVAMAAVRIYNYLTEARK
ncbi:MAG: MotA/TolQ/ExbB proton channel family protein [Candidatus Acidoferrales bacterium]